jgi:hypothetical protein
MYTFLDLFHYLYYKIRERGNVPQLQGLVPPPPNLREEFACYFQVSNESNLKSNNAPNLNTAGARLEYWP